MNLQTALHLAVERQHTQIVRVSKKFHESCLENERGLEVIKLFFMLNSHELENFNLHILPFTP